MTNLPQIQGNVFIVLHLINGIYVNLDHPVTGVRSDAGLHEEQFQIRDYSIRGEMLILLNVQLIFIDKSSQTNEIHILYSFY